MFDALSALFILLACVISGNTVCAEVSAEHAATDRQWWAGDKPTINLQSAADTAGLEYEFEGEAGERHQLQKLFSRIHTDLEPWRGGISQGMIERTYCQELRAGFRIQVIKGHAYIMGEKKGFDEFNRMTKLLLLTLTHDHALPDVDFVVSTEDGCPDQTQYTGNNSDCQHAAPLFTYSRRAQQQPQCVLIPDFTFGHGGWPMAKLPSWHLARYVMETAKNQAQSWSQRLPKLFFRGAPTGERMRLDTDEKFKSDDAVDFKLTGWTGLTAEEEYVSLPEHCDHRHLLHLTGNAWSVRLKYLLLCEAAVIYPFNPIGGWEEFWTPLLQDGIHLMMTPALKEANASAHLLTALRQLEADPQKALGMAIAGRKLVREVLTPLNVQRYLVELLKAYARLQKFTPVLHPDARRLDYAVMRPDLNMQRSPSSCASCAL